MIRDYDWDDYERLIQFVKYKEGLEVCTYCDWRICCIPHFDKHLKKHLRVN